MSVSVYWQAGWCWLVSLSHFPQGVTVSFGIVLETEGTVTVMVKFHILFSVYASINLSLSALVSTNSYNSFIPLIHPPLIFISYVPTSRIQLLRMHPPLRISSRAHQPLL